MSDNYTDARFAARLFQSLREEQEERRHPQRDETAADEPDHIDLSKLLERNKND